MSPHSRPVPTADDPIAFADRFLPRNEKGVRWRLAPYQRTLLAQMVAHPYRLRVWSEPKKSGKTFIGAVLGLWWAFTHAKTEVLVCANDLEQSVSRVFATMSALLRENPALGASAVVRAQSIQLTNGTLITAIASEYRGAAGARHSLAIFDELWGYDSERAHRLYEELTPPPTEPDAWILVTTYAGFTGESQLLEALYRRGLAGHRLDAELEGYAADDLWMFWSHTPRQPWQTPQYYAEQQRGLRPATFARLHRNEWVSAESAFITPALWDACVDATAHPLLPGGGEPLFVGVDASTKHDSSAVVAVRWAGERLALATHRLWQPTAATPLDLEGTIEATLRDLHARYRVRAILVDPYQMHRSITTLKAAGLPIEEFPQTTDRTTRMGQALFDLLTGRNLILYPSPELRAQALATVAIESPRGFRIAKERASRKIDAVVAMSMACVAALDGRPRPLMIYAKDLGTPVPRPDGQGVYGPKTSRFLRGE